jgi:hypothetical protein
MPEETYDRLHLAKGQLETPLNLFLDDGNYASSITLAGAAEEVFGRELIRRGLKSALESEYESMADFDRLIGGPGLNKKAYIAKSNLARDALKHLQENKGPATTIDLEEAACWMLVRAIQNGRELGFKVERYREFDDWFHENIVGV